jgi:pSer/pThr/pTyr-binding forkhead associated (FHA) protein
MSFKNWILHKMNGLATRSDLPRSPVLRSPAAENPAVVRRDPRRASGANDVDVPAAPHLGAYAPLIGAIREELEHFVASYLRLHLAIAERDRYLLTSIDVQPTEAGPDDAAELVRRFMREFKPEQIKRYLANEVIAGLPNASAIDLSQFAGLNAERAEESDDDGDDYSELLADLRSSKPTQGARAYEVSLIGRWSEASASSTAPSSRVDALRTPLAGRVVEIGIEDADGRRQVVLPSVVPGRRYAIGKGEGCDVVVNGLYASRRHCEIWLDRGAWWVSDAGSTNGIRIERGRRVLGHSMSSEGVSGEPTVLELAIGTSIVLSAQADGVPAQYPRLTLGTARDASASTPAVTSAAAPATPSTPIVPARSAAEDFEITVQTASGSRTVELRAVDLPFSIGRSRSQSLVIDWAHQSVSGQHLEITEIDYAGVDVVVHGDNGVAVAGTSYRPGARLRWKPGESMTLGRSVGSELECRLTLSRHTS